MSADGGRSLFPVLTLSGRALAPLRKAEGALVLDTGELDVDACVEAIVAHLPEPRG